MLMLMLIKNEKNLEIKFPNDLLLNSKKICGVLTEINTISEKVNYLILQLCNYA